MEGLSFGELTNAMAAPDGRCLSREETSCRSSAAALAKTVPQSPTRGWRKILAVGYHGVVFPTSHRLPAVSSRYAKPRPTTK
jgi:hypothetical protein